MRKYKLVPVEPTAAMMFAWVRAVNGSHNEYIAMLSASPPASQDEMLVEQVAEAIWKCKYGPGNRMAAERIARAVLKLLEGGER